MANDDIIYKLSGDILGVSFNKDELKLEHAERIVEIVFDLEEHWDVDKIVFEMSKVEYVNSSFISAIGRIADAKELKIVSMTRKVANIMETMGLLSFLDIFESTEDALKDFGG